jgi:CyaY protein
MLHHGGSVEEREFLALADAELAQIEAALEKLQDTSDADWDFELKPGGIIELDFGDGGKIIINRHAAAREIWIAARSGGFHFKPPVSAGGLWLDSRESKGMASVLSRCISEQAGVTTKLDW